MRRTIASSVVCLGLASLLSIPSYGAGGEGSGDREIDLTLDRMITLEGSAYLEAREQLLRLGKRAEIPLRSRLERASFDRASWRRDVTVAILVAWLAAPESAARAYALDGIAPRRYLARRRPEPEVGRELKRLQGATPILFEIALYTASVYPFATLDAYPERLGAQEIQNLRVKERHALREGALTAIAASGHPAAPLLLEHILRDDAVDVRIRRVAALGLGQTGSPEGTSLLRSIAEDRSAPDELRTAALQGLGQVRSRSSLDVLVRVVLRSDAPPAIRQAAIASLGTFGSAWVLKRRAPPGEAEALRQIAGAALVEVLLGPEGASLEVPIENAMAMIGHPAVLDALRATRDAQGVTAEARARAQRGAARMERALSRGP